jgi:glucose/arabinose dehydrogenase
VAACQHSDLKRRELQGRHTLFASGKLQKESNVVRPDHPKRRDNKRIFATGIRNCVGMTVAPSSGELWCSTNERDGLGDDVPADYVTHVREELPHV